LIDGLNDGSTGMSAPEMPPWAPPGSTRIAHIGYVVENIGDAVAWFVKAVGAGPFFLLENIDFDSTDFQGSQGLFRHSAAFGQWAQVCIELQQLDEIAPAALRERLEPGLPAVNHIAYIVDDPDAESSRLESLGMPRYLRAQNDGADVTWHETPCLGHSLEIHRSSQFVRDFFAGVAAAAGQWDGKKPLRIGPP
jgi:hypothetical protein